MFRRFTPLLIAITLSTASLTTFAANPDPISYAWALERGDVKQVKTWLDEGMDPEYKANQLGNGLMNAAWYGNIELMELFVSKGANPRRANQNGEQAIQLAAWNGQMEAVKWLLAHGSSINREDNHWSALHYAAFNGHIALAKYLIEHGANVNAKSPNGTTPLMIAAREGRDDVAKTLLEAGANTKSKNEWGDTALTMAMRYDHYKLGKMISSPEEFEIAAKAPKEDFGPAEKSAAAPNEIEELLKKIREAEANGQSSKEYRAQLKKIIDDFRSRAVARRNSGKPLPLPYQPRAIVITAQKGKPEAERAEVVTETTPKSTASARTKIADIMRQIRLAEIEGRPTEALRQQLYQATESMK